MFKQKWIKHVITLLVAMAMLAQMGCGGNNNTDTGNNNTNTGNENSSGEGGGGKPKGDLVYFLNFKPEIAEVYEKIAKDYKAETGVGVKVVTAAAGTYETRLKSEIAKSDAPTIFQINGPIGFRSWKNYTLDLSKTKLYSYLSDQSLAVKEGEGVYGIPYVVEGYGIIYNDEIVKRYFALPDKKTNVTKMEEVNNFETLRTVVEDMQANKEKLGIKGVFAATSLGAGEQWRWQSHLLSIPLFYEFSKDKKGDPIISVLEAPEIKFTYGDQYRNIFDLYVQNSTVKPTLLGSKSVSDSMAEFALGQAAMVQNGNWAWSQISQVEGNTVKAENVKFLPIYTGVTDEEKQGLAIGTENYLAVNSQVSAEKQQASIAFLEWLFSSETGKKYVVEELGLIAPFNTFEENERPADPLAKEVLAWMGKDKVSVPWTFAGFPSDTYKNNVGDALLEYAQGKKTWDDVQKVIVESWKTERQK